MKIDEERERERRNRETKILSCLDRWYMDGGFFFFFSMKNNSLQSNDWIERISTFKWQSTATMMMRKREIEEECLDKEDEKFRLKYLFTDLLTNQRNTRMRTTRHHLVRFFRWLLFVKWNYSNLFSVCFSLLSLIEYSISQQLHIRYETTDASLQQQPNRKKNCSHDKIWLTYPSAFFFFLISLSFSHSNKHSLSTFLISREKNKNERSINEDG